MARLEILQAPHPTLKSVARPVAQVDDAVRALMNDMLETMYAAPGIGLAAPQIGVLHRVVVIDIGRDEDARDPFRFVNPEITWRSEEEETAEEGCLSLPEQFADVTRAKAIKLRYLDEAGEPKELEAEDMMARCIQHEVDHLNGVLIVDHISALKRRMILKKL
ncbi:MAG: peptide deformylase, partial [Pseudomonadota bacterium]